AVVTGAGDAFCAGLDLREAAELGESFFAELRASDAINLVATMSKPTIAAVNGPAITGGLELALNCDFIVASTHAAFADTHARVGVVPGGGLTVRLPRVVGLANAKAMSLTGRVIRADEAARLGLVHSLVEPAALLDSALALAKMITEGDSATTRE